MVSKRDTAAELQTGQHRAAASTSLPAAGCDPEGPAERFPPERLQHRHFQSTHTENHWTVQSGQTSWCGNHSSVLRAALTLSSFFFFWGQGLVTFHILTLQIDNKQFVRVQPGQYMSISSSRFSYLFPDSPSLHYTSLYHCAQMLYICAIVA